MFGKLVGQKRNISMVWKSIQNTDFCFKGFDLEMPFWKNKDTVSPVILFFCIDHLEFE